MRRAPARCEPGGEAPARRFKHPLGLRGGAHRHIDRAFPALYEAMADMVEAMFMDLQEATSTQPADPKREQARKSAAAPSLQQGLPVAPEAQSGTLAPVSSQLGGQPAQATDAAAELFIDITTRDVRLWGIEISRKPPKNLQPQLFLALAVLALNANKFVATAAIAEAMQKLSRSPCKPVLPDARDLRYRILRVLRYHLGDLATAKDLGQLVENVQGAGLRLNCRAQVIRAGDELSVAAVQRNNG